MKKKVAKVGKSITTNELAQMVQRGFADMATKDGVDNKIAGLEKKIDSLRVGLKDDMKEMQDDIESSMERHIRTFRNDYDDLAFRVKKLEHKVFEKR